MTDRTTAGPRSLGLGRSADAIGWCVLVFAFLPTLAALPAWLFFEARNPLNLSDPVVLVFLPVRGAILLLHAFREGVVPGVLAGLVDGLLVCAFVRRFGVPAAAGGRWTVGGVAGALAAVTVVAGILGSGLARGGGLEAALARVGFEVASGVICGTLAAARAMRLAAGPDGTTVAAVPAVPSAS